MKLFHCKSLLFLLSVVPLFYLGHTYAADTQIAARNFERGAHPMEGREDEMRRGDFNRNMPYGGYHPEARGFEEGAAAGSAVNGAANSGVEVVPQYVPPPVQYPNTPPPQ